MASIGMLWLAAVPDVSSTSLEYANVAQANVG